MSFEFTAPRFLLCEGDDDKGLLEALIHEHGLPEFQVRHSAECNNAGVDGKPVGGRSGFQHSLDGFRPITSFSVVKAILIVSDNDKPDSFREVQDEIRAVGQTPPASLTEVGSLFGKPLAVLMVPTDRHGDFEALCLPEIHRVWPKADECVTAFMTCTGADNWTKSSSINKAKARAPVVGFYQDDPYKGIGHLFRNRTLSTTNTCFQPIVDFLRRFDALVGI